MSGNAEEQPVPMKQVNRWPPIDLVRPLFFYMGLG
jgi:hypothetical protein